MTRINRSVGAVALMATIVFLPGALSQSTWRESPQSAPLASAQNRTIVPLALASADQPLVASPSSVRATGAADPSTPPRRRPGAAGGARSADGRGSDDATRGGWRRVVGNNDSADQNARDGGASRDSFRALGADAMVAIIEVAEEVSPKWGDELRARLEQDPDGLRRSIVSNGRRLIALAVLRDQEPELYRLKVTELRHQSETTAAIRAYREAVDAGQEMRADALLQDVRRHVRQQIDHDLRTRAEELAALDQQMRRLKERLVDDSINRDARIDALLAELLATAGDGDAEGDGLSTPWVVPPAP